MTTKKSRNCNNISSAVANIAPQQISAISTNTSLTLHQATEKQHQRRDIYKNSTSRLLRTHVQLQKERKHVSEVTAATHCHITKQCNLKLQRCENHKTETLQQWNKAWEAVQLTCCEDSGQPIHIRRNRLQMQYASAISLESVNEPSPDTVTESQSNTHRRDYRSSA